MNTQILIDNLERQTTVLIAQLATSGGLRSYRRRVQRIAASETDRGRSLWEAILDYLSQRDLVSRREILDRFRNDDDTLLRGVLKDRAAVSP